MARLGRGWRVQPRVARFFTPNLSGLTTPVVDGLGLDNGINQWYQRATFTAAGRDWLVYDPDGSGASITSTADGGATWLPPVRLVNESPRHVAVRFDGTYMHYAAGGQLVALRYRRGVPNADGSITWSAAEQEAIPATAGFGDRMYEPDVAVDSDGVPWVITEKWEDGNVRPVVAKATSADGTWTTDFEFEPSGTLTYTWTSIQKLNETGAMIALYWMGDTGLGPVGIYARVYDGSSWGSEFQVDSLYTWNENYGTVAVVTDTAAGRAFVTYGATVFDSPNVAIREPGGTWSLETASINPATSMAIGFDDANSDVYLVYVDPGDSGIRLTVRNGTTWSSPATIVNLGSTDLVPFTLKLSERAASSKFLLAYQVEEAAPARILTHDVALVAPSASISLTGSGGGAASLTGSHSTTRALTATGGGAATLRAAKARTATITASGGGGAAITRARASRSSLTPTGGGGATLATSSFDPVVTTSSGGGSATLTARKTGAGAVNSSGGGAGTISAVKTPDVGGVLWTGLFGGGGRVGRSHPAIGLVTRGTVPMNVANPEARSGTVSGTGGGDQRSTTGAKGGLSFTVEFTAIPPVFFEQRAGVITHGGGSITYSYSRSAAGVGLVVGSGGGSATTTAAKGGRGATTGTGGGDDTLTTPRGARGTVTSSGGGGGTFSYALSEFRSGTAQGTGGGNASTSRQKNAAGATAGTGGGQAAMRLGRATSGNVTGTGGGTASVTVNAAGPIATGSITGHGGGNASLAGTRGGQATVNATGGGGLVLIGGRGITGTTAGTGGGTGTLSVIVLGASLHFSEGAPAGRILVAAPTGTITA